jgi:hypothetical protein
MPQRKRSSYALRLLGFSCAAMTDRAQPVTLCCMRNAVALANKVHGIRQAPPGLGVGHRADSNWTCRSANTSGIAETTPAARGHIYLWLRLPDERTLVGIAERYATMRRNPVSPC